VLELSRGKLLPERCDGDSMRGWYLLSTGPHDELHKLPCGPVFVVHGIDCLPELPRQHVL
jgi:hypothetical protein